MSKQSKMRKESRRKAKKKEITRRVEDAHMLMKRMTRDHIDVLQNIEAILVFGYRADHSIDDNVVMDTLRGALQDKVPADPRASIMLENLEKVFSTRGDVSKETRADALRVVMQSVGRHSTLMPGSREYLNFVCQFIV